MRDKADSIKQPENSYPSYNQGLVLHSELMSRFRGRRRSQGRSMLARLRRVSMGAVVGIILGLITSHAASQEPSPSTTKDQPPPTATPAPPAPAPGLPIVSYPVQLLGLLAPPAQRGPLTLLPSIGVSEEYNDNVHSDNRNRESDFITNFSPAITLSVYRPSYQLNAGYSFSAALYAEGTQANQAFESQNFIGSGSFLVERGLTLSLSDAFAYNNTNTNLVSAQGFSTGQQKSLSNTISPGMTWQMTQLNSLSISASYSALRYLGSGTGADSDTYGIQTGVSHTFTRRLSGNLGYAFTYLDLRDQQNSTSHTGTIGFGYQLTPTLSATINGGAAVTVIGGDTSVSPAANATLTQAFSFGSAGLQYTQGVGVGGGFGGTTNTQTVSAFLTISTLLRGLSVVFGAQYSRSDSLSGQQQQARQVDVWATGLNLGATYQIAPLLSVFGQYQFFLQRTGGSSSTQVNVDQNRVLFGLRLGYPINFD